VLDALMEQRGVLAALMEQRAALISPQPAIHYPAPNENKQYLFYVL